VADGLVWGFAGEVWADGAAVEPDWLVAPGDDEDWEEEDGAGTQTRPSAAAVRKLKISAGSFLRAGVQGTNIDSSLLSE
jgi:hypothetical protein